MRDWLNLLADPGSTVPIPGTDESVAAARCRIDGRELVLVWCRFDVSAGTLSVAAGERFVAAVDHAVAARLPVLGIANSGGARMQEGSRGFVQMIAATRAVRRLRDAGLPLVVYTANPTTGGVFASWASLGHLTFAEPGATIGFTGPRVAQALGEPIVPASSQTAEGVLANGHVDAVVAPDDLRSTMAQVLATLAPATPAGPLSGPPSAAPAEAVEGPLGWAAVQGSRGPTHRRVLDDLLALATSVIELVGDRAGSVGSQSTCVIARIDGRPVVVVGHRPGARPTAADLRAARRAMTIAQELGLPVVTVIDTPGAEISGEQERQGLAGEIARSIDTLSSLTVPSVAVIAGQGSGGAAMAWLAAARVIAAADAWLAPIAPEAASLIVHRDTDHAAELADAQQVGAVELRDQGIVDAVFAPGDLIDAVVASLR